MRSDSPADNFPRKGILLGLLAYCIWGSFPLFFKALERVDALEIVCHRIVWSAAFLVLLVAASGQLGKVWRTLHDRSVLLTLSGSTMLIAINWLVFMFAIQRGEVLQSSLGYFINPLVSVFLGFCFLGERLNRWQQVSVLLALIGVVNLTIYNAQLPWIALILATSFGLYGLLRKMAKVEALIGLTIETLLLAPMALGYLVYLSIQQQGAFLAGSLASDLLLPLSGVVTAVPLLCFVGAARRLRLATIGFLQYITPSLHFAIAVGLFGELFSLGHMVTFIFIWAGLGIYSGDAIWRSRRNWRGIPGNRLNTEIAEK